MGWKGMEMMIQQRGSFEMKIPSKDLGFIIQLKQHISKQMVVSVSMMMFLSDSGTTADGKKSDLHQSGYIQPVDTCGT